jgi:1,4-dihydroxy-6-naphthoate synthase
MKPLTIGYSPCPNDTFIFYALMHGHIPLAQIQFSPPVLADVEQLNRWAMESRLDVTKLSFHALGHVLDDYVMLSAGAALGRGCGPLLVSREKKFSLKPGARIAIPGTYTTAALLLELFAPEGITPVVLRFDQIMEAVQNGEVEAGVIIHEGRFTYQDMGLHCIQDLGQWWEEETGFPIPLGCIAARATLGKPVLEEIDSSIRNSLAWIRQHPGQGRDYIRAHAQEFDAQVLENHIGLYVNDFSDRLGEEGLQAVQELLRRGREQGIFPSGGELQWVDS